jgi:hypothetical protein
MVSLNHLARFLLLFVSFLLLLLALSAGLMRLGWNLAWPQSVIALDHGPLMVCGFLGTLISLERAVALGRWWGYLAPVLAGLGSLALAVNRLVRPGMLLIVLSGVGLVGIFAFIIAKQPALFTATMGLGAVAWLVGDVLWLAGIAIPQMVHWWIAFLVLTIVGERLELNRLRPPSRYTRALFGLGLALYVVGLIWASIHQARGNQIAGVGIVVLALWLALYDVARFTVRQKGLPRFIALCLFGGYVWLGVGGLIWVFQSQLEAAGSPAFFVYDAALHTVLLGFVFSMIFAHAPIVFPAVVGRPLAFRRWFYVHVLLLHVALVWRIAGDLIGSFSAFRRGGLLTVIAVLLFLGASMAGIVIGQRETRASSRTPKNPIATPERGTVGDAH